MLVMLTMTEDILTHLTTAYPYMLVFFACVGFAGVATLFLPSLYRTLCCFRPQNLRTKYQAEWAIVTGGSSGIGKAIVDKLCSQDINVIILAVPDDLLTETAREMSLKYSGVDIIPVGADLSRPGYMEALEEVTSDKNVQLLFCNAGFMLSGFFADTHVNASKANSAVNVGCHLELTHAYLNRMLDFSPHEKNGKRGAIFFTSSPAWMLPSPTAAMYAGTKAFVTHFGCSLAAEVRSKGVDVCVVHPSPIRSRFYDNAGDGAEVNFFKSTATGPEVLVNHMFASVGKLVLSNQGYFPKVMGMMHKIVDPSFLAEITAMVAHTAASFKDAEEKASQQQKKKKKKKTPRAKKSRGKSRGKKD
jgi:short-subunit dehydrogenase